MKKIKFIILLQLIVFYVGAQNMVNVKGTVRDAVTKEELIGVSVLVTEGKSGTVTDVNGAFSIMAPSNGTLRISYVGYKPQQVKINGQTTLNIQLAQESSTLDELVVVGYAVQKKRDILGAVSNVSDKELNAVPVATAQQALQGRVAGVQVSVQTGAPGSDVSVHIRGVNSISLGNEPLYIVDGIAVEGALNNISTSDIDNITVLKDASSAAIYGSRATNGIVVITTKLGKSGEAKISYSMQMGLQAHGRLTPMASTDQYISLYNEAANTDNATSSVKRALIEGNYVKDFPNVNHLEEIFRTAPLQTHELSISGGTDKTKYLFSASYFNQDGIIKNTGYDRINLRSNVSSQVKKWLQLGMNISGGISNTRYVSSSGDGYVSEGGSVVRYALFRNPAIPVYDNSGNYVDLPSEYYGNSVYNSFFGDGYSPEGLVANTDMTKKIKVLLASGNSIITFNKNLFLKSAYGIDYKQTIGRIYNKTWGTNGRINSSNSLNLSYITNTNWTVNSTLNYNLKIGENHSFTSLIGAEAIKNNTNELYTNDSGFTNSDPDFLYIGKGEGASSSSQTDTESSLLSFFANVNYNFNQKYYASATIRRDGSSRFSEGNRWGTFYSVSAGWNLDSEEFMKNFSNINKLKLRTGYGAIGNQNVGLYAYSDRYSSNYYYAFGGSSYNGYTQSTLGNAKLKWETNNQFNVGVDLEMYKGTFGASIDYFYKVTHNMLVQSALPLSVGDAATPWINTGSMLNTGVDVELFYRKNYKDGGFSITLNGGFLHNEVLSLESPILGGRVDTGVFATKTEVGHPIGSFYLYQMDGIFQNDAEVLTSAYQGKNIAAGDVKYKNMNKDNVIDANDRAYSGSSIPTFTTGLTLTGNYKGFDASVFFQGAFGQKIFSQVNYDIEGFYRGFNVTERYYNEHWTGEGSSNTQPRASWAAKANNVKASTRFLEDGSYVRLKNVQVGYTIPKQKYLKGANIRLYIAATNLLTFTKYNGLDPEMTVSTNSASEGDRANGIDWGTYPVAKSYTFGLNVTL